MKIKNKRARNNIFLKTWKLFQIKKWSNIKWYFLRGNPGFITRNFNGLFLKKMLITCCWKQQKNKEYMRNH